MSLRPYPCVLLSCVIINSSLSSALFGGNGDGYGTSSLSMCVINPPVIFICPLSSYIILCAVISRHW